MDYAILILTVWNTLMLLAVAASVARLLARAHEQDESETFDVTSEKHDRQITYADQFMMSEKAAPEQPRHWDGIPRAKNWDGIPQLPE